jgi:hypothetical protein
MYLRRFRIAGRSFATGAPLLTHVSAVVTPLAHAAQNRRTGLLQLRLVLGWRSAGARMALGWRSAGARLAHGWRTDSARLAHGWHTAGARLAHA